MRLEQCPHCGISLAGELIPDGDGRRYGLAIGIEIWGVYDGVLFWQCPSCERRWHRWPDGHYLRTRAEKYVNG
jgi:hypothetical protein